MVKKKSVPVIFEPPCILQALLRFPLLVSKLIIPLHLEIFSCKTLFIVLCELVQIYSSQVTLSCQLFSLLLKLSALSVSNNS